MKRLSFALVGILLAVNAAAGFPLTWWGPGYYSAASSPVQYYNSLNTGEIARYEFEQSGADWRDGWHLTQVGTVPYSSPTAETFGNWAAGPFSTSNYFTLDKTLLQGRSVWSMVIKFTSDGTTAANQRLFQFIDTPGNSYMIQKQASTGNLQWQHGSGGTTTIIYSAIPAGDYTISFVYDGVKASVWINGNLKAMFMGAFTVPATLLSANIGVGNGPSSPWLGTISAIRLYSRALTDYELQTPITDNVAYYGMQQSGADWSGQKNHLTTVGNVPYALQSDGSYAAGPFSASNYFTIPPATVNGLAAWSFSFWVYATTTTNSPQGFRIQDSAPNRLLDFEANAGTNAFRFGLTYDTNPRKDFDTPVTLNTWTHLAFTYDSGNCVAYKNGVSYKTDTAGIFSWGAGTTKILGYGASSRPWPGYIRKFTSYSRALTPAEIAADYAASFPPALTGSEVATENIDKNTTNAHWRRRR